MTPIHSDHTARVTHATPLVDGSRSGVGVEDRCCRAMSSMFRDMIVLSILKRASLCACLQSWGDAACFFSATDA